MKKNTLNTNKIKFRTQYNRELTPSNSEKIDPVSITIQNDTYSLRDIIEKFSKEYPKHLLRQGYYDGDENYDEIDPTRSPDFDLSEAFELKKELVEKSSKKKLLSSLKNTENKPETDTKQLTEKEAFNDKP